MADIPLYDTKLWVKLEARAIPEPNSGCLLWLQGVFSNGYGVACAPLALDASLALIGWRGYHTTDPFRPDYSFAINATCGHASTQPTCFSVLPPKTLPT